MGPNSIWLVSLKRGEQNTDPQGVKAMWKQREGSLPQAKAQLRRSDPADISQTSSLQNHEEPNFYCLNQSVSGIMAALPN